MNNNFKRVGNVILLLDCTIFTIWLFWHGTAVEAMTIFAATGALFWLYGDTVFSNTTRASAPRKGVTALTVQPDYIILIHCLACLTACPILTMKSLYKLCPALQTLYLMSGTRQSEEFENESLH